MEAKALLSGWNECLKKQNIEGYRTFTVDKDNT